MSPYDIRHYRFARTLADSPELEAYSPPRIRWGIVAVLVVLGILAMALPA